MDKDSLLDDVKRFLEEWEDEVFEANETEVMEAMRIFVLTGEYMDVYDILGKYM